MTISLVPLVVFVIGLLLWLLPTASMGRAQEVGRVLMLAGAIGFCLAQGGHSLSIH